MGIPLEMPASTRAGARCVCPLRKCNPMPQSGGFKSVSSPFCSFSANLEYVSPVAQHTALTPDCSSAPSTHWDKSHPHGQVTPMREESHPQEGQHQGSDPASWSPQVPVQTCTLECRAHMYTHTLPQFLLSAISFWGTYNGKR